MLTLASPWDTLRRPAYRRILRVQQSPALDPTAGCGTTRAHLCKMHPFKNLIGGDQLAPPSFKTAVHFLAELKKGGWGLISFLKRPSSLHLCPPVTSYLNFYFLFIIQLQTKCHPFSQRYPLPRRQNYIWQGFISRVSSEIFSWSKLQLIIRAAFTGTTVLA